MFCLVPLLQERADSVEEKTRKAEEDTETGLERGKRKADGVEKEPFEMKRLKTKERAAQGKPKPKFKLWCDVCSVGAFSETVMRNHELGKKHLAAIDKQKEQPPETSAAASSSLITAPASSVTLLENANGMALNETGKKTVMIIRCETCDIVTNSEKMMEMHKLGKKHKAQLKKQCPEQMMVETQQNSKPLDVLDTISPSEITE